MKLTKGKLLKIYNKKKETMRKYKIKIKKTRRGKTFRKKRHLNLNNKTLKSFFQRGGGDPKLEKIVSEFANELEKYITNRDSQITNSSGDGAIYQKPDTAITAAAKTVDNAFISSKEGRSDDVPSDQRSILEPRLESEPESDLKAVPETVTQESTQVLEPNGSVTADDQTQPGADISLI